MSYCLRKKKIDGKGDRGTEGVGVGVRRTRDRQEGLCMSNPLTLCSEGLPTQHSDSALSALIPALTSHSRADHGVVKVLCPVCVQWRKTLEGPEGRCLPVFPIGRLWLLAVPLLYRKEEPRLNVSCGSTTHSIKPHLDTLPIFLREHS